MPRALFNDTVIAEADSTRMVEGNHYFPPESIHREYFEPSDVRTTCPWKGEAEYFDVVVDGKRAEHAAWHYPNAKEQAKDFEGYVAFWRGVTIEP